MPKTVKPLTYTQIRSATSRLKEYSLSDGKGLALRISPKGDKYWIFNYQRPRTKVRANLSVGVFPDISLSEAREKRDEYRKLLTRDIDPRTLRMPQKLKVENTAVNSLEQVAVDWMRVKRSKVSQDHADDIWRSLELHVFPYLGKKSIFEISAPLVIDILRPIEAKGSRETVKRLCQRLNEIMVFAVNTGVIEGANPISGVKEAFLSPLKNHFPTLRPEELPNLLRDIQVASIRITTKNLLLWQLHTMVRPSEAAGTRWSEIDSKKKLWIIPAHRMKRQHEHTVPLTDQTISILEKMKPISWRSDFVFPSDRKINEPSNSQTVNMALKRMGYKGKLVSHGLRSLASTTLNEAGFDADIIEAALAHVDKNSVRAAYNRATSLARRQPLMSWWSNKIHEGFSLAGLSSL